MRDNMNRAEFMRQLESLLQNISPAEREEALQYYNDYFDDAGSENEQSVIEALGNPAKVAENIKKDLYGNGYGDAAFQRAVYGNRDVVQYQQSANSAGANNENTAGNTAASASASDKMPVWVIVLLVILCIFASPVLFGAATAVAGALFGAVITWFSLIFAAAITALAFLAVMVVLLVVAAMCSVVSPLTGVALLGGGLFCGGLGILALMLTVAMAGIATPAMCRGIAWVWRKLFDKKQAA